VIGLGRFGTELATQLSASGVEVLAIDTSKELVDEIKDSVDVAVRMDSTDRQSLASQELESLDVCIVSIGENFENALLTTVLLKKLGVKRILVRAQTATHAEIFEQIGVDEVIRPELQAGQHLARRIANPQLEDILIFQPGFALIELRAPEIFQHKTPREAQLREKYNVNLVAVKRPLNGDGLEFKTSVPTGDDTIEPDDILVLVGSSDALAHLPKD